MRLFQIIVTCDKVVRLCLVHRAIIQESYTKPSHRAYSRLHLEIQVVATRRWFTRIVTTSHVLVSIHIHAWMKHFESRRQANYHPCGTIRCSSNPPLPNLVHPTFPPSTTATMIVLSPCLSERNVFTCGVSSCLLMVFLPKTFLSHPGTQEVAVVDEAGVGSGRGVPAGGARRRR